MTTGKRLRAAREAKGMSLGDIARRTYIQPKFLQAIDDDDFSQIPSSHRKLFVREYAKVIGLDAADLLDEVDEYAPPVQPVNNVDSAQTWQTAPVGAESNGGVSVPPPVVDHERGGEYREVLRRLSSGRGVKLSGPNTSRWLIG